MEADMDDVEITAVDPVCGKVLKLEAAVAQEDYQGWAYFFCSQRCRRLFVSSPARFAKRPEDGDARPSDKVVF
jgi:YHS domain-containing protein